MNCKELIEKLEYYRNQVLQMGEPEPDIHIRDKDGCIVDIEEIDLWENFSKEYDVMIKMEQNEL